MSQADKLPKYVIFTFAVNTETQEAAIAGNVEAQIALQLLQQLVIAEALQKIGEKTKEV